MNILYGLYKPDEGEILLNGKPISIDSPHAAIAAGIGMVHQHFMLIPVMTVAENIVLAAEPTKAGVVLDTAAAERRVRELADQFKFHIDPRARIQDITVGPAAARRDPEGALPPRRHPHPRRADRGADAAGGDRALRDPQEPRRRGHVGHLHLAQAERGARHRRPRHRAAARQEGRHDPARRRDRGEPGADDGRPRGAAARRQAEGARRARRFSRSRTCTSSTTAASRPCAASRSRCAPARSSRSQASTATGRRS